MKFSKVRVALLATVMAAIIAIPSYGQAVVDKNRSFFSPDQQFGFGVNNAGLHVQYAMGPAFHLGLNLNLDFQSKSSTSSSAYNFGPYAKFLFSGDVIKPYLYGALGVIKPNTGQANVLLHGSSTGGDTTVINLPKTEIRIYLAFGGEHFFNQNVGVYGHVNLVDAIVSPTESQETHFGLNGGVVGIEFFF